MKGVQNGFEQLNSQTTLSVFNFNHRNLDHSNLRSERFRLVHIGVLVQSCDGQQTQTPNPHHFTFLCSPPSTGIIAIHSCFLVDLVKCRFTIKLLLIWEHETVKMPETKVSKWIQTCFSILACSQIVRTGIFRRN